MATVVEDLAMAGDGRGQGRVRGEQTQTRMRQEEQKGNHTIRGGENEAAVPSMMID